MMTTIEDAELHMQRQNLLLEQLIPKMAEGSTGALEEIYSITKTAVYGFALSILKNPHTAEDVMQDTYIRLYGAASGYRPQGKPMAWILTIVRNLALMKLRSADQNQTPYDEGWLISAPGDFAQESVDKITLHAALSILSDQERQIVILHGLSGLKHREISALLALPLSTVLSKYKRALSKLEKHIKEEAV